MWLEDEALEWYNGSNWAITYWTFCDIIEGLYDRFIHASSIQDVREGFRRVTYSPTAGIQSFYDTLLDHAQNMSVYPDDYSILEQFLTGIPDWMATKMFEDFRFLPESNTLDDFVAMAKAIEQRGKTKTYYAAMKQNIRGTTLNMTNRAPLRMTMCKQSASNHRTPPSKPSPPIRFACPAPRYANNKAKPSDRYDPHYHSSTPKRQATASDSCFNCGKTGHFTISAPFCQCRKKITYEQLTQPCIVERRKIRISSIGSRRWMRGKQGKILCWRSQLQLLWYDNRNTLLKEEQCFSLLQE